MSPTPPISSPPIFRRAPGAKDLIAQLQEMDGDDELFDAKVTVLNEQIDHHVKEEEGEIFPRAKRAKLDNRTLGAQMAARKLELMSTMSSKARKAASANRSSAR